QLDELRRRRKTVAGKLDAQEKRLSKMGSENKSLSLATEQLTSLQNELRQLDSSILVDMARLSDHKRTASHSIMVTKFGGLLELGEKFTIIGELGKLLSNEIPQEQTQPGHGRAPYFGREAASNLVAEAARCVSEVAFNPNAGSGQKPRPQRLSVQRPAGYPEGTGEGPLTPMRSSVEGAESSSRFTDKPSTSYLPHHQGSSSLSAAGRGTMPPNREYGAPLDEFGRPLDGLPPQANTMPPLRNSGGSPPIQQVPLSAIQQSMRHPDSAMPPPGQSGFRPPPQDGRSGFRAPGPPPALTGPPQQRGQAPYNQPGMPQYPPKQGGATVERGLTLSLPIRSPAPPELDENGSPISPSKQSNARPSGSRRQGTVGENVVLADEANLKRTSTLPPKVGIGLGDFPEWSLGLGELGLGDSPIKELPEPKEEGANAAAAPSPNPAVQERQDIPVPPAKEETVSSDGKSLAPLSAIPRGMQSETNSAAQTPITETPTSYSKTQTPTAGTPTTTANPDNIVIHHIIDNPSTRTGSSGRFAQFPDKRKQTTQQGSGGESLLPPHPKYTAHPGMDRTPSPGLGNQDLKSLQETINKEKEILDIAGIGIAKHVLTRAQRLSRDLAVGSEALKQWGAGEGEDLSDLWHSAMLLTNHLSTALNTFADHQLSIRAQLKDVRTKEEQLDELRRRRKT
ncbi:4823_t:CDS:2, partial [Acaulospora colombiana]